MGSPIEPPHLKENRIETKNSVLGAPNRALLERLLGALGKGRMPYEQGMRCLTRIVWAYFATAAGYRCSCGKGCSGTKDRE